MKAYSTVVYARTVSEENHVNVKFVCAKARVATLKELKIPRLELKAALLLPKLISRVANVLKIGREKLFSFSDSTIVLNWVKAPTSQLKQFVSNRVRQINSLVHVDSWRYIFIKNNPADLATRGF